MNKIVFIIFAVLKSGQLLFEYEHCTGLCFFFCVQLLTVSIDFPFYNKTVIRFFFKCVFRGLVYSCSYSHTILSHYLSDYWSSSKVCLYSVVWNTKTLSNTRVKIKSYSFGLVKSLTYSNWRHFSQNSMESMLCTVAGLRCLGVAVTVSREQNEAQAAYLRGNVILI